MKVSRLIYVIVLCFTTSILLAQEANDVVHMLNGETKNGKVTGIHEKTVDFIYQGEDLKYELQKENILKIVFASGRTQVITKPAVKTTNNNPLVSAAQRKNKLAVLPFTMVSNEQDLMSVAMSEQIQHATINSFKKHTHQIIVQDPMTTNALLLKNNLNAENIKSMMPAKIAELLGVEYVVYGTANISFEGTRSFGSSSTTYKDKTKNSRNRNNKERKSSGSEFSSNSSSTVSNYDTSIELNIFSDTGSNLYSVSRNSFGSSLDTYKGTLNYLIKRCPWGSKH